MTSSFVDDITIHYYTYEDDPYEVYLEGSILTLKHLNENLSKSSDSKPNVEFVVPREYAGAFQMDTSNGAVSVSGLRSVRYVNINTSNAPIDLEHVAFASL